MTASPTKLVYDFGTPHLECGSEAFGYRHIKANHKSQFSTLAQAVGKNWEGLVHFSIHWANIDPDATRHNSSNGKHCKSRTLYLANSNGLIVSTRVYKLIYTDSGRILTAFPTSLQCRNADVGLSGAEPVSAPLAKR